MARTRPNALISIAAVLALGGLLWWGQFWTKEAVDVVLEDNVVLTLSNGDGLPTSGGFKQIANGQEVKVSFTVSSDQYPTPFLRARIQIREGYDGSGVVLMEKDTTLYKLDYPTSFYLPNLSVSGQTGQYPSQCLLSVEVYIQSNETDDWFDNHPSNNKYFEMVWVN